MSRSDRFQPSGLEIAVIGMAGRFPSAPDLGRFWENLRGGVDSVVMYSDEELDAIGIDRAVYSDPTFVRAAALLPGSEWFDAGFFGFSPREAEQMDPQQRVFLEASWEALEDAGYDGASYPGPIGVYAGVGMDAYLLFNLLHSDTDLRNVLQLTIGNEKDFLATRVSYKLDLTGPSFNVQTGCSTSLVAVHLACQGLLAYQCDMALAGAVALRLPRQVGYLYQPEGILAPDGRCRSYSSRAQGAIPGSGLGIVVLKRLADAQADGDTIHAVIKGSAINNDGASKVGYTAPSVVGQARVIAQAQAAAGVEAATISYVEGHGSGTPLGDPIEVAALTRAFRKGTQERGFCGLGSVKTNIGHLDTAAGMAGLLKTVMALEHEELPPSLHFESANPEIDFASSPFYVVSEGREWKRGEEPRRAGVSSFGIGGTNAHVILEEAPETPEVSASSADRKWELLALSARSEASLEQATDNLASHLGAHPEQSLADVAHTLQVGRRRFGYRRVLVCAVEEPGAAVAQALAERDPRRLLSGYEETTERPVAFLLPGLGDQYPGMAAGLYRDEPVFRREVDGAAELLLKRLGVDLRPLLFPKQESSATTGGGVDLRAMLGRKTESAGTVGELGRTGLAQPALFVVEYALARLLESWGVRPAALLGYSLGEYVAACLAGVFSLEDALLLVAERARLIEGLPAGAMLAVPLPEADVLALVAESGGQLSLAAVNGPSLAVVAGSLDAVATLAKRLSERGVTTRPLQTSHAFHSWMMEPVAELVTELASTVELRVPSVPLVSNVTGTWMTAEQATDPSYWA
ncbi:MAG TPA: type I polyketide synthase, partial [Thermoanaerobaculia bacterium]